MEEWDLDQKRYLSPEKFLQLLLDFEQYELVKRNPFTEYNPGISEYKLVKISTVRKYKR